MKKLHVISVKETSDSWILNLSSYSPKAIKDRKEELLKKYNINQIKINHYTMDEEEYAYKITVGLNVLDKGTVQVDNIIISPDLLKSLNDATITKSINIKYTNDNSKVIIYMYGKNEADILSKSATIIEDVIKVISNKLSKCIDYEKFNS